MQTPRKTYCYIDEAGQDVSSPYFVVAVVIPDCDRDILRGRLLEVERLSRFGRKKWHKLRPKNRMTYIDAVMNAHLGYGEVYLWRAEKPCAYVDAVSAATATAIRCARGENTEVVVTIDGLEKTKAPDFTKVLRRHGIILQMVRGKTDESDPLIRLADMWAGCARAAFLNERKPRERLARALRTGYLRLLP